MAPYRQPSVFNFYQSDYSNGLISTKGGVSPESQILTGPTVIGYLNGLLSLFELGSSNCDSGFFTQRTEGPCHKQRKHPDQTNYLDPADYFSGSMAWTPNNNEPISIVSELDLLLTGGRLSDHSAKIIEDEIAKRQSEDFEGAGDELSAAFELFTASPEFNIANSVHLPVEEPREESSIVEDGVVYVAEDYKVSERSGAERSGAKRSGGGGGHHRRSTYNTTKCENSKLEKKKKN